MAHARLIFMTAAGQQSIDLGPKSTLGRHPDNAIHLLDKIVAKEHCILERRDGSYVLRDLGSISGTYVNGERVRGEQALQHGDEIAMGATRARYDDGTGPMNFAMPAISPGAIAPQEPPWGARGGGGAQPPPAAPAMAGQPDLPAGKRR